MAQLCQPLRALSPCVFVIKRIGHGLPRTEGADHDRNKSAEPKRRGRKHWEHDGCSFGRRGMPSSNVQTSA